MYTFGLAVLLEAALALLAPVSTIVSQTPVAADTAVMSVEEKPLGIPPVGFVFTGVEEPQKEHIFGLTEEDRRVAELNALAAKAAVSVYGHEALYAPVPDIVETTVSATGEAIGVVKTVQKAMRKGAKLTVVVSQTVESPVNVVVDPQPPQWWAEPYFDFSTMSVEEFEERSRTSLPYALFQEEWGCEDNGFEGLMSNLPVDFVNMRMGGELETHRVATSTGVCSQFRTIAPKGIMLVVSLYPNGDRTVCFEATDKPGEITLIRYP